MGASQSAEENQNNSSPPLDSPTSSSIPHLQTQQAASNNRVDNLTPVQVGMKRNESLGYRNAGTTGDPEAPPAYDDLFGGVPSSRADPPQILQNSAVLFPDFGHSSSEASPNFFRPFQSGSSGTQQPSFQTAHAPNFTGHSANPFAPSHVQPSWQQNEEGNELRMWFSAVDENNDGFITSEELRQALLNDNWSPFNMDTIQMMLKMFDRNLNDRIEFEEFSGLKKYVQEWKKVFDRYDVDHSGTIDVNEIQSAFTGMNYNFSLDFCRNLCRRFDNSSGSEINLDAFIYASAMVNALAKEHAKNPYPASYEAYLTAWINQR